MALAGAVFLAAVPGAEASDINGDFAVRGVGAQSCATLTQQIEADPQTIPLVAASWLMGYLTAINRTQDGTYDMMPVSDPAGIYQMVVGLCAANPDQLVEAVTDTVVRLVAPSRVTLASPIIETAAGEYRAALRQDVLRRMQLRLAELGYAVGNTGGNFDDATGAALSLYQTAENLPVTGVPDSATILRVLVEQGNSPPPQ